MDFTVKLLLVLIKCLLFLTAHSANMNGDTKIIGGHDAQPNSHPYLVSLKIRFLWVRAHICGGAILKENWILSAAHCSLESWLLRLLPMDAVAGTNHADKLDPTAQVTKIKENIPHPLYSGGIGPYDIAVFKTETPFTFTKYVQPIKLPADESLKDLKSLKLAGWGALRTTAFIPDLPNRLQEVEVTYIPYDECYRAVEGVTEPGESNPLDEEAHICTGPISGGVAACSGDSGGPLVHYIADIINPPYDEVEENTQVYNKDDYNCGNDISDGTTEDQTDNTTEPNNQIDNTTEPNNEIDNGTETINVTESDKANREGKQYGQLIPVVVGVVSWGASPCGLKGAPTVYTNVSTYLDFINYNINYT